MNRVLLFFKTSCYMIGWALMVLCLTTVSVLAKDNGSPDFVSLFEQVSPAVVNISTLAKPKERHFLFAPGVDEIPDVFRRYFGIPLPDESYSERSEPMSLGSGFIISSDGYILTNNHVVDGAEKIMVRLSDRSERIADVVGADKRSDLALLKIKSSRSLPVVKFGDSRNIKPGQWVAAIGSPFNFEYSVTKGIVSAINRSLPTDAYVPFIQTDVPINPGNSGGPLLNMAGEVIGINSQIFTRSGGFMGLSFAIPVDHVRWAIDQLKDKGYVTRGWLGVAIQDVDRDLAESFDLERPMGALISQVVPGGPADLAKLLPGDIITQFNDVVISSSSVLPMSVGVRTPGEKVKIDYIRNGKRKSANVEVGQLPDENNYTYGIKEDKSASDKNPLGLQVASLDDNYRSKLFLDADVNGIVVIGVTSGVGRFIGLRRGDVITDINHFKVATVSEFEQVVGKLPKNRSISMRFIRNGNPAYITFRLQD